MVEYRIDARTGTVGLMEINGQFWICLPLAYHAGVPFAWYTYAVLGLGSSGSAPLPCGIRCRYCARDASHHHPDTIRGRLKNREVAAVFGEIFKLSVSFLV